MSIVLVTGANGFVGSAIMRKLQMGERFSVRGSVRDLGRTHGRNSEYVEIKGLGNNCDWSAALERVDAVIHTAALTKLKNTKDAVSETSFRRINVFGTLELARQAAQAGVARFIFLSSIKVNGELTSDDPFNIDDPPNPEDPYSVSKYEAECGLLETSKETGMEVVIVRPPLVYGPGVKGNFASMMRWVARGVPLPFGLVRNRRSLIGIDNLVDLLITCLDHPAAAGQTLLVSDGEDLSTAELLRRVGQAMGRKVHLIPVPPLILELAATIFGKRAMARRLLGSLQVDMSKTRNLLGWSPQVSVDEGLRRAVVASDEGA